MIHYVTSSHLNMSIESSSLNTIPWSIPPQSMTSSHQIDGIHHSPPPSQHSNLGPWPSWQLCHKGQLGHLPHSILIQGVTSKATIYLSIHFSCSPPICTNVTLRQYGAMSCFISIIVKPNFDVEFTTWGTIVGWSLDGNQLANKAYRYLNIWSWIWDRLIHVLFNWCGTL